MSRLGIEGVFEKTDALEDEYIDFWRNICMIESPTELKTGVDAVGAFISERATARGWSVEKKIEHISGDPICITLNPDASGAPLVLSGHVDTVHPVGFFGTPAVTLDEKCIYGPGTCDCKGGVAAAFYAMAALDDAGFRERPIKLIIQTDEENSSRTSNKRTVDFMAKNADGCAAFLNLEGHKHGRATVGRKGIIKYEVEVTGVSFHAAQCYDGASAIREVAHKIIELERMQDKDGISINCGVISGGTSSNTVAEKCVFTIDARFPDEASKNEAERIVSKIVEHSYVEGTTSVLKKQSERVAMEITEKNLSLLEALNSALKTAGLDMLSQNYRNGGSDAADMTARGIPTLDSLGVEGGYIHTRREYAWLSSLKEAAKRIEVAALLL